MFCLFVLNCPTIVFAVDPTTGTASNVVELVSTGNVTTTNTNCSYNSNGGVYCLLAPIPGISSDGKTVPIKSGGLSTYLQNLYKFGIYISIGLAVLMIVIGGLQYVSTDAINGKDEGRNRITEALKGLVLALMAYLILNTLNTNLLTSDITLKASVNLPSNTDIGSANTTGGGVSTGGGGTGASGVGNNGLVNVPTTNNGGVTTNTTGTQTTGSQTEAQLQAQFDALAKEYNTTTDPARKAQIQTQIKPIGDQLSAVKAQNGTTVISSGSTNSSTNTQTTQVQTTGATPAPTGGANPVLPTTADGSFGSTINPVLFQ